MKRIVVLTGLGAGAFILRKLRRRQSQSVPDFTSVDTERPQEKIEEIEDVTDVPGGVRP